MTASWANLRGVITTAGQGSVTSARSVQLSLYNLLNSHADVAVYFYSTRLTPNASASVGTLSAPDNYFQIHPLEPISARRAITKTF